MDFILVVILFFIFLSLVGNSWVIFIIARRRRLQTTANLFILSLAAADLGVTCVLAPCTIYDVILDTCKEEVVEIFAFFLRERLRHRVDRHGRRTLCCNRAFAEIRPHLQDHHKNIYYYWDLLGISISIHRFETRHVSCRRQTFGC